MGVLKLKDNVYSVGVLDPNLKTFDVEMSLTHGSTYNAYLIVLNNGNGILIDGVKAPFTDEWLNNIKEVISFDKITTLILNHSEPDHSGSIAAFLKLNPDITVYGSFLALKNLENIVNAPFNSHRVMDGEEATFDNVTLQFLQTPNVHWPDTIITYYKEQKVAFTSDFLGAHYCPPSLRLSEIPSKENYDYFFRYYFDALMAPFKKDVRVAVKKITELDLEEVYPSHGPVLDDKNAAMQAIRRYSTWAIIKRRFRPKITIVYVSSYGYTEKLAKTIAEVINVPNVDLFTYNLQYTSLNTIVDELENSDGILFGSPTFVGDALGIMYNVLNALNPFRMQGKVVSAFGSYGWTGEAVPNILARCKQLRMNVINDGLRVRLNPSDQDLENARQFASDFLTKVKENFKI